MFREYEITPRGAELGGGWELKFVEANGKASGGAVFPIEFDAAAGELWWNSLAESDRAKRLSRCGSGSTWSDAYRGQLSYKAHEDAVVLGEEWNESFLGHSD